MGDQTWYLYQNGQQIGPFDTHQVTQLYINKMVSHDGYIFKVGWKEWRPMEEGYEELNVPRPDGVAQDQTALEKRKNGAPRATISGRVVVHNDGQLSIGNGVNISSTGMFVETEDQLFTVGEQLKLTVKCNGIQKAFNVLAQVIRFNSDPRFPIGYGLKFENLETSIREEIQQLVEQGGASDSSEKISGSEGI